MIYTEELTSRKKSGEIPQVLRKLGDGIENSPPPKDGNSDENQPIDLLLATNMLSVGVDIPRLGAMVVNGQPKQLSLKELLNIFLEYRELTIVKRTKYKLLDSYKTS